MAIQHDTSVRKWLVLVASFFNMFFCAGFPFNMSVLNTEFLRVFERSKAETALVQSVISGTLLIAGYPCGQSVNRFGVRKMGILSGLLASVGLSVSFFATSIPYLVITVGIITGLGLSLAFVASTTATGWLLDLTGTYTVAYYSAAASHGVAVCLFCLAALIRKHNQLTSDKYHLGDSVDGP
ncbi:monocarboxylate transporter 6-like isoform X2 [Mizuhopecten yessoensis]|uniref:monocarboxylate transporter 6-like isoform X2 n=1 Tax=Mizuhopecten yessoensis TaxID=6573 RepID=UPI000B45EDD4|nr:monocarboxylate transporter 6-like isoform X2 [Mizuhopecten yessoensis]